MKTMKVEERIFPNLPVPATIEGESMTIYEGYMTKEDMITEYQYAGNQLEAWRELMYHPSAEDFDGMPTETELEPVLDVRHTDELDMFDTYDIRMINFEKKKKEAQARMDWLARKEAVNDDKVPDSPPVPPQGGKE